MCRRGWIGCPGVGWHWLIVIALGATWILDGLEVTLAGSFGGILTHRETLGLNDTGRRERDLLSRGAVIGAILFWLRNGSVRSKKLFFITVAVYLVATALDRVLVEFRQLRVISRR